MTEDEALEEALLEELALLHDELGVPPRTIDMGKHGRFSPALYSDIFGSWKKSLEKAGVEGEPRRPPDDVEPNLDAVREWDTDATGETTAENDLLDSHKDTEETERKDAEEKFDEHQLLILAAAERVEGVPTPESLRRRGHSANAVIDEYGTWENALASVGIELPEKMRAVREEKRRRGRRDEEKLLDEVRKYRNIHGKAPTEKDVKETDWMSPVGEYMEVFGAVWSAVDTLREGEDEEDKEPSEDELVSELKRYYLRNGEVPTRQDVRNSTTLSELSSYIDNFGDVRSAVEAAGLAERAEYRGEDGK